MARWSDERRRGRIASVSHAAWGSALAVVLLARAVPVQAQESPSVFERLGLDRLQFVSLGAAVGRIDPTQVEAAQIYAISADYGEIARNLRVVFEVSYWESRFSDRAVSTFLDTLRANITDPTGDYSIATSRISVYDVTFSGSLRWQSTATVAFRPYASVGIAGHVINAEGRLIKGTFVERSLDSISSGFFGNGGVLFRPWGRVIFDAQARADLMSGFRSVQLRAGALYLFGPLRRPAR